MKSLSLIAVLSLFLAVALSACGGKSDAEIKKEVDGRVKNPAITSAVKDGVVTLTGTVETSAAEQAAKTAAAGEGVKSVTDNIQIKPAATPMPMPMNTPMTSASPGAKMGASPSASAKPMATAAKH